MSQLYVCIFLILTTVDATFDCRRPSQTCQNGGECSYEFPFCLCKPETEYDGYDCGLVNATKDVNDCTTSNPCVPGQGHCYDNDGMNGAAKCYCKKEYYGDSCGDNRFTVLCSPYYMVIGINPIGNFSGVAYVKGTKGTPECESGPVPSDPVTTDRVPDDWEGHFISLDHNSSACPVATLTKLADNLEYSRTIVIQYNTDFMTNIDDSFTVTCQVTLNGTVVSSTAARINPDLASLNAVSRSDTVSPVIFGVLTANGVITNEAISIGEELLFFFHIADEYESLIVLSGEANNNLHVGTKILTLIEDGCMHPDAFPIIKQPPRRVAGDKREVNLILKAFLFDGSDEVMFRYTVKVCLVDNDADCNPANCAGRTYYDRRKRSAEEDTVLEKILKIRDPSAIIQTSSTDEHECPVTKEILAVIILMAILLFFSLVLSTVLIARLVTSPSRPKSNPKWTSKY